VSTGVSPKPAPPAKRPGSARRHAVTLIPGDGAGEEVCEQIVRLVAAAGVDVDWDRQPAGAGERGFAGPSIPASLVESVRARKVALKGRIRTPLGAGYESPNVQIRKQLELYASIRPARNFPGLPARYEGIDIVVVRENTEDMYSGIEHEVVPGVVQSLKVVTEAASTRIARVAFDYAVEHGRKAVACVHKANIMKQADGLFLECCRRVAAEYPAVKYREVIADAACMQLVTNPYAFDVMVMGNLYGDIISDICAGLVGGSGAVPGINIGAEIAVFEAIHGSPGDMAGRNLANPLPLLVPAVHMLRHLGESGAADRIMTAAGRVLGEGRALTPELGGRATLSAMIDAIAGELPAAAPGS